MSKEELVEKTDKNLKIQECKDEIKKYFLERLDAETDENSSCVFVEQKVYNIMSSQEVADIIEKHGCTRVDIRMYSIIYDAIEEVKAAMEGMLAPVVKEVVTSSIEVREVFHITKVGTVAGAMVKEGKVKRSDKARLVRDGIVIFSGSINALKRFKDDVKEVAFNYECGISLVNFNDLKVGDVIETYEEVEVKQTL
jgi:translation initiation factor IF-2